MAVAPLYFPRQEFRDLGLSEVAVRALEKAVFVGQLLEGQETLDEDLTDTALLAILTEARVDDLEAFQADGPYVKEDQTPAWADSTGTGSRAAFATYAGQTISNPPTQAEVQAIDDHVKLMSQRLGQLINDLRSVGVLT